MHPSNNSRRNAEKPVEGCAAESVVQEMHLHVLWNDRNSHGELGEIPDEVQLEEPLDDDAVRSNSR